MLKIKNLEGFIYPLEALKNQINSVVFNLEVGKVKVNAKSADDKHLVNITWDSSTIETKDTLKLGIYDLGQFLTTLKMFGENEIEAEVEEQKLKLKYGDRKNINVKYNLSDSNLITEGPSKLKKEIEYLVSLELDKDFLKKVRTISSSLSVNVLKFERKDKKISYQISDKYFHSHLVKEVLVEDSAGEDFEVCLNTEKLNILPEGYPITININPKIVEFNVIGPSVEQMRYYMGPLTIE